MEAAVKEEKKSVPEVLRVGSLAKRTGKTVRALHLYEEMGLLTPVSRSRGGYRLFALEAELRVHWIAKLQDMGFSLTEIRDLISGWQRSESAPGAMRDLSARYRHRLQSTRHQIERLQTLARDLQDGLDYLEACQSCDPERVVEDCARCDQPHCSDEQPVLIAGLHPPTASSHRSHGPAPMRSQGNKET